MIPFGSQRGSGGDLAVHLQNALDNEYVEIADLRGALAEDLNGAFAEWEAQAHSMTKCQNYLYSLSINPDQRQGRLTRDQYDDYIARVEESLGLAGQPRAVVYHIKEEREHCHVVWSRIDIQDYKAIQIAFDKQKLMMVTREFARDHDLQLPDGYFKEKTDELEKNKQMLLHEKSQQDTTGLTKEERIDLITDLWRQSDSAKAFVSGLEQHGYLLATGRKPYVLVDLYGNTNALPRMIGDNAIRTNDIREFLGKEYEPKKLMSVEDAQDLVAEHREVLKQHHVKEQQNDRRDQLKELQEKRKAALAKDIADRLQRQKDERKALEENQLAERSEARTAFLAESKRLRDEREAAKPTGLAGFLSRVSGVEMIRRKLHHHQDKERHSLFQAEKLERQHRQQVQQEEQRLQHQVQAMETTRKEQALKEQCDREMLSLEKAFLLEQQTYMRRGHEHMPSLQMDLKPPGRFAVPHKAKNRFSAPQQDDAQNETELAEPSTNHDSLSPSKPTEGQSEMNKEFTEVSQPQVDVEQETEGRGGNANEIGTRFDSSPDNDQDQGRDR